MKTWRLLKRKRHGTKKGGSCCCWFQVLGNWLGFEGEKKRKTYRKKREFVCSFGVSLGLPPHEGFYSMFFLGVWKMTQTGLLHGK